MNAAEREKHRKMILDPMEWPHMLLPLVKRDGSLSIACLLTATDDPAKPLTIDKNRNLFGLPTEDGAVERITYADVDALLDDGWEVD